MITESGKSHMTIAHGKLTNSGAKPRCDTQHLSIGIARKTNGNVKPMVCDLFSKSV